MRIPTDRGRSGRRRRTPRPFALRNGNERYAAERHGALGSGQGRTRLGIESLEDRRVLAAVPFVQQTVFEGGLDRSQAVAVADLDGDGDLDAVAASGNEVWVLENDGSAQFGEPVIYASGSGGDVRGLLLEDLTGDGRPDLVVGLLAGDDDNAASLLINDGSGAFGEPVQLIGGLDAEFIEAMDAGDTDGDGDIDLIVGERGDNRRILHLVNEGSGVFAAAVDLDFDSLTEPKGLKIVDFDGDGDNDVVVTSSLEDEANDDFPFNYVFWYKNDGSGTFSQSLETDVAADPRFLDVADFDGDGDQDIVLPEQGANQITLFIGDGTNTIGAPTILDQDDVNLDQVERTQFVDVDGDGDLDVLFTADGADVVGFYVNNGGSLDSLSIISDQTNQASGLASGDFDGDGDLDVMTTSQFHATVNLHLNNGDGTWSTSELTGPNTIAPEAALFADFDGDGDQDVLAIGSVDFEIAWYENVGGTFNTRDQNIVIDVDRAPSETFPLWWDVEVADLDGDGDIDIVTTEPFTYSDGDIVWYQNDGAGNFTQLSTGEPLGATEIEVVDIDGDGDLDLVTGQVFGGLYDLENSYVWYENDGAGEFTTRSISTTADTSFAEIAYGDIDGDGDIDLLFGDNAFNGTSSVIWYQQFDDNGEVGFEEIAFIESDRGGILEVGLADMDGDGDLDAVTASYDSPPEGDTQIRWYENVDGMGNFSTDPTLIGLQFFVSETKLVDVDNDGDIDLLSPNRYGRATLEWFDNLGDGTFAPDPVVIEELIITGDTGIAGGDRVMMILDVADINGDGRLDIVVPASDENRIALFLSTDEVADPFDLNGDQVVDIADVNLLCTDIASGTMQYDVNGDGQTTFADMEAMIQTRLETVFGDSDLSGSFGSSDLVNIFIAGEYEDALADNSTYSTGDWNCDGDFNSSDLVFTFTLGTYDPIANATAANATAANATAANAMAASATRFQRELIGAVSGGLLKADIAAAEIATVDTATVDTQVTGHATRADDQAHADQPRKALSDWATLPQRRGQPSASVDILTLTSQKLQAVDEVFAQLSSALRG